MLEEKNIIAVVPARSGSKGIPNKNIRKICGVSLIGWTGIVLNKVPFLDAIIISTDSAEYAEEGKQYGLAAPFLRPDALSNDQAGAWETIQHALLESERYYSKQFDIILIIEPTSPLRTREDIISSVKKLIESNADSVVTVSPVSGKVHPFKILTCKAEKLDFCMAEGKSIKSRQQLTGEYYWRNGICYALTRHCLIDKKAIITDNTLPLIISRDVINIDDPIELEFAELLLKKMINN